MAGDLSHILVWVSVAMKRHHEHSYCYKGKPLIGAGLQFRGLIYYHLVGHGGMQEDIVLEKELKNLYLDQRQQEVN